MKYLFDRSNMNLAALGLVTLLLLLLMWWIGPFAPAAALLPDSCKLPGADSAKRFASIKQDEAYMRAGPSTDHRIRWVFRRIGMPVLVLHKKAKWWYVHDWQGDGGWMRSSLLSPFRRTALVIEDRSVLWRGASSSDPAIASLEEGVIGDLGQCRGQLCELKIDGYPIGWVLKSALWGV